jgi:hypothetical protein
MSEDQNSPINKRTFFISVVSTQTNIPESTLNRWSQLLEKEKGITFLKDSAGKRLYVEENIQMFQELIDKRTYYEAIHGKKKAIDQAFKDVLPKYIDPEVKAFMEEGEKTPEEIQKKAQEMFLKRIEENNIVFDGQDEKNNTPALTKTQFGDMFQEYSKELFGHFHQQMEEERMIHQKEIQQERLLHQKELEKQRLEHQMQLERMFDEVLLKMQEKEDKRGFFNIFKKKQKKKEETPKKQATLGQLALESTKEKKEKKQS